MKRVLLIGAALALVASMGPALSQDFSPEKRSAPAQGPQPGRKKAPQDNCNGREALEKILALNLTKTQFETAKEFEDRARAEIQKRHPEIKFRDVFCELRYESRPERLEYDAEKKVVKARYLSDMTLRSEREYNGEYQASNAFGARVTVKRVRSATWEIQWLGKPRFWDLTFPMPAKEAQAQFDDLRLGIVADLVPPYASKETGVIRAKLDSPYETDYDWRKLKMRPKRIMLYNSKTGAVIHDYPFAECKNYGDAELRVGGCPNLAAGIPG